MTAETDTELVALVRQGSRDAAGRLAVRYLKQCRAVAMSILREISDAEDVAQDAFVYAMERIADCRRPDRFGAWVFRIVRSRAYNRIRDSRRTVFLSDAVPSVQVSPAVDAERALLRDRLMAALEAREANAQRVHALVTLSNEAVRDGRAPAPEDLAAMFATGAAQ